MKRHIRVCLSRLPLAGVLLFFGFAGAAAENPVPVRTAAESVNDAEVREQPGLRPNDNLLFNGWGITPVGSQVTVSDMPLKMIVSPDGKFLLAVSAGFNNTGLTILSPSERKAVQFEPLRQCWNGLAFTKDRKRVLVSGGASGVVHVLTYENGKAAMEKEVQPLPSSKRVFLAGIG